MNDEAALFQAILADPEDESLRLVYADLMEERGDLARAEFIRVQCELEHLTARHKRRAALETRECELLQEHRRHWNAPLHRWLGGTELRGQLKSRRHAIRAVSYRRGFVEGVVVQATAFVDHGELLFGLGPVQHVRLLRWVPDVVVCPHLARLLTLDVHGNNLSDADAFRLAASPHGGRLTALDVSYNFLTDRGVAVLGSTGSTLLQVTALRTDGNLLTRRGPAPVLPARVERLEVCLRRWLRVLHGGRP
ncbi:MAG: TIGR02996 domain-containing protein [Gemmataceae bacterium]|nr:TIGR02996 domain-containing protein [Gemmataceae bacterium]